jgi:hypothetical protein
MSRQNHAPSYKVTNREMRNMEKLGRRVRQFPYAGLPSAPRHNYTGRPGAGLCELCLGFRDDYRHW